MVSGGLPSVLYVSISGFCSEKKKVVIKSSKIEKKMTIPFGEV